MRCPKCKSTSFELSETFEETEIREVREGVASKERLDHFAGRVLGYSCECGCGHRWVPRNKSVDELEL